MGTWTYEVGEKPAIKLANCSGDLAIEGWDEPTVEIATDSDEELHEAISHSDEEVQLKGVDASLRLRVPGNAWIEAEQQHGSVSIKKVAAVRLVTIAGDVALRAITGDIELEALAGNLLIKEAGHVVGRESIAGDTRISDTAALELEEIGGNLQVSDVASVVIERVRGDVTLSDAGERCQIGSVAGNLALHDAGPVEIEAVGGDFHANDVSSVSIERINGNAVLSDISERCRIDSVAGDLALRDIGPINIRHVGGNLIAKDAQGLEVAEVAGDCTVKSEEDATKLGDIHGNLQARIEEGLLQVGQVRGDAAIKGTLAGLDLGNLSGNLTLQLEPTGTNTYRANVAGDAVLSFSDASNITIHAVAGGNIVGLGGAQSRRQGGAISTVFGTGDARLELTVGGNLIVRGAGSAARSTWGPDFGTFPEEMAQLGKDLAEMGREIAASFAGSAGVWASRRAGHRAEREAERAARRAEQAAERVARRAEQEAARAARRAEREVERAMRYANRAGVQLEPEQLERIKQQARAAAEAGIARAQQAVEQALRNLGRPGRAADEEVRQAEQGPPTSSVRTPPPPGAPPTGPVTGQTVHLGQAERQGGSIDEERLAILRMLEEGRITPEEAEELLAALDGTGER